VTVAARPLTQSLVAQFDTSGATTFEILAIARAPDGARIYYEVAGGGLGAPAVLLVMGFALRGELWGETRDRLASAGYRTLTMDNRGVGQSRVMSFSQTTAVMADDAVAVMKAAFVSRAHVVGLSLGGMVAQQIALRHPRRVDALVLQSTSAGLPRADFIPAGGLRRAGAMLRARNEDLDARARAVLKLLTTDDYARRADLSDPRLLPLIEAIREHVPGAGQIAQLRAASRHRTWRLLKHISARTLVQHGAADRVVSWRAGRALAARIPGATLEVYRDAGHLLALQRPDSIDSLETFLTGAGGPPAL
jgi:pimeloyl-ACP methyl ester carboxylesterase